VARHSDNNHKSNRSGGSGHRGRNQPRHQTITSVTSGQLPKWVREDIFRSTPKDRREPALGHLSKAMQQFADERYAAALPELRSAKELSPRSSTIRELLGLSAYRSGRWEEALRELRTFRRISGDLIHMPVEMDCLRALGRKEDVTKTWERIQEHDISATVSNEARVVYASFLLDEGRAREAWPIIKPGVGGMWLPGLLWRPAIRTPPDASWLLSTSKSPTSKVLTNSASLSARESVPGSRHTPHCRTSHMLRGEISWISI